LGYSQPLEPSSIKTPEPLHQILILSADQKEIFVTILQEQHEKRENIRLSYRASRQAERAEMDALHQDTLVRLQSVLTEAQITQFDELSKRPHPPRPSDKNWRGIGSVPATF
jgi:hypothetical protein